MPNSLLWCFTPSHLPRGAVKFPFSRVAHSSGSLLMLAEEAVKELQILFSSYYVCFESLILSPHVPQDTNHCCVRILQDLPVTP